MKKLFPKHILFTFSDCSEDDEDEKVGEVRFVPEDKESCK